MMSQAEGEDHAQPMVLLGRSLAILYGTETGNSEDIARELGDMAERLHFQTVVDEMNSFGLKDLLHFTLVIFVCSTTGQGDMPGCAAELWKTLLRKRLRPGCLDKVKFTIFGLGDSSYPKFNWAARKLHKRLIQLGASEFYASGEGDERHDDGIDSIYMPWQQGLRTALLSDYPLPDSVQPLSDDIQLPPKMLFQLWSNSAVKKDAGHCGIITGPESVDRHPSDLNNRLLEEATQDADLPPEDLLPIPGARLARVSENTRVTPEGHWQDVRHLVFSIELDPADRVEVGPGSTLIVYPKNYPSDVQTLIDMMEWNGVADEPLQWASYVGSHYVPGLMAEHDVTTHFKRPSKIHAQPGATLRHLLTNNFDITAVPKRSFLKELVYYTPNELEKERLLELTAAGNSDDFYDYTFRPRRTILEVLSDFPSVKIPFERLIDAFPMIRGREFSIANGAESLKAGTVTTSSTLTIHVLAALVEYRTIIRKPRQGLCSRYLKTLREGGSVKVKIKRNSSTLLADHDLDHRPLIAVATGTGIAPIKHLMDDRFAKTAPESRGETMLFFGCRNESADYYYRDYWESQQGLEVIPAFSRDPLPESAEDAIGQSGDYDSGKNYVQHQIRHHSHRVAELIAKDALICVCGNSGRMPKSVRDALLDAIVIGGLAETRDDAEKVFQKLKFWQETW